MGEEPVLATTPTDGNRLVTHAQDASIPTLEKGEGPPTCEAPDGFIASPDTSGGRFDPETATMLRLHHETPCSRSPFRRQHKIWAASLHHFNPSVLPYTTTERDRVRSEHIAWELPDPAPCQQKHPEPPHSLSSRDPCRCHSKPEGSSQVRDAGGVLLTAGVPSCPRPDLRESHPLRWETCPSALPAASERHPSLSDRSDARPHHGEDTRGESQALGHEESHHEDHTPTPLHLGIITRGSLVSNAPLEPQCPDEGTYRSAGHTRSPARPCTPTPRKTVAVP